jgi:hypothetical protein
MLVVRLIGKLDCIVFDHPWHLSEKDFDLIDMHKFRFARITLNGNIIAHSPLSANHSNKIHYTLSAMPRVA